MTFQVWNLKLKKKNITAGFDWKYGKFWMYQKFLKDQCQKTDHFFQNQQESKYLSMHVSTVKLGDEELFGYPKIVQCSTGPAKRHLEKKGKTCNVIGRIYMICPTIKFVRKLSADAHSKWHVICPNFSLVRAVSGLKVRIFWEGHKIWKIFHLKFDITE